MKEPLIKLSDAIAVCRANRDRAYAQGRGDFIAHEIDAEQIQQLEVVGDYAHYLKSSAVLEAIEWSSSKPSSSTTVGKELE